MKNAAWCGGVFCQWRGEPEDLHEREGRKLCPRCGSDQVTVEYYRAPGKEASAMSKKIPVIITETGEQISTSRDIEGRVQLEIPPVANAHIDLRMLLAWAAVEHPDLVPQTAGRPTTRDLLIDIARWHHAGPSGLPGDLERRIQSALGYEGWDRSRYIDAIRQTPWMTPPLASSWRGETPECMKLTRDITIDPNGHEVRIDKQLSPSEAVYGVLAWLTTVENPIVLSAHHNAGVAAIAADLFCKANKLAAPRGAWNRVLLHPKEEPEKPGRSVTIEVGKPIRHREVVDNEMLAAKHLDGSETTAGMVKRKSILEPAVTIVTCPEHSCMEHEQCRKATRMCACAECERAIAAFDARPGHGAARALNETVAKKIIGDALDTYRGLLVGLHSPNWQRPSDAKLDEMLDVAKRATACLEHHAHAKETSMSFADIGKSPAFQALAQEATRATLVDTFKSSAVVTAILGDPPRPPPAEVDYTAMQGGELAERCGDRGDRWALAFAQHAMKLGIVEVKEWGPGFDVKSWRSLDQGWLIGWFANAIEAACDARDRRAKQEHPVVYVKLKYEDVLATFRLLTSSTLRIDPTDRERALLTAIVEHVSAALADVARQVMR